MSQWRPSPPQGSTTEQGLVIIGRPPIPKFSPPQGIAVGIAPPPPVVVIDPLLAIYPTIGDLDYTNYKFYQVNKGEFNTPQTDFIWEITDSVGPGVFQEASGFDIRPFLNNERDLTNARDNNNSFDSQIAIVNAIQLSDDQLHLFFWPLGATGIEEWVLSSPRVFPPTGTPSDFQFIPLEGNGRDVKIIDNGSKMALVGVNDDTVRTYSLPTPNSLAPSVSFSGIDLLASPEDTAPTDIVFSSDGLTLFMTGATNDKIYQYDLSIPNDLSTAVFSGNELDVSTEDTSPQGVVISNDGLTIFVSGFTTRRIYQYNLSIPNDLSTAVYSGIEFDATPQDPDPLGISLSPDGLTLFVVGFINDAIYQYDLSTPNSLVGAVYSGNELVVSAQDTQPRGVAISNDGLTLLMAGDQNDAIYQYDLSIPNDLSTAVFSGIELDVSTEDTQPRGLTISTDGLTLLMVGTSTDSIYQYNIITPNFLQTTPILLESFDTTFLFTAPASCDFSKDGMQLYIINAPDDEVLQWNLLTPFTLPLPSTAPDRTFPFNPTVDRSTGNSRISPDGEFFYLIEDLPTDSITKYFNTDSPNQIPIINKSPDASFVVDLVGGNLRTMSLSLDGSLIWLISRTDNILFELFIPGQLLEYEVVSVNITTGDFTIKVKVPSIQDLTFVQLAIGNATATDGSTPLGVTAVYSGNDLDVSTEDTIPQDVAISTDGLVMFMLGVDTDRIYQYSLSTPNDLSTAVYSNISLDVSTEDTFPVGLDLSSDGSTIFMLGLNSEKIFQYDLPAPNSLVVNTTTFSGIDFNVSTESTSTVGLALSPDGLTLFMAGTNEGKIFQYDLSVADDLSTAVYSGNELDISSEDLFPHGITLSTDGLTLFVVGFMNDTIFQYDLSVANDLSTAVYSGIFLDVSAQDTFPEGLTISPDGLTLFMSGTTNDKIFQYDFTTPNDLSTASFSGNDLDVSPQDTFPSGITISANGLTLLVSGDISDRIYQYNLSVANDLSTAVYSNISLDISPQDTLPTGIVFSSDGLTLLMVGFANAKIFQYDLGTSNSLANVASFSGNELDISTEDGSPRGVTIATDGLTLFMTGAMNDKIYQYDLPTPNSLVDTTVFSGNDLNVSSQDTLPLGLALSSDGLTLFQIGLVNDRIFQYDLSTPNDLSTAVYSGNSLSVTTQDTSPRGLALSSDGLTLFISGTTNDKIFQYDLSTANSLVGAVYSGNELDVSTEDTSPQGVALSSDGLTLFMSGDSNNKIYQYDFTTPNDLSTASFSGNELDVSTEDTFTEGLTISPDGLTLFMVGLLNDKIYQYDFTTPNDLSTASFSGNDLDVSLQDTFPEGITISSDGLTLFISGLTNNKIYQYNLPTPNSLEDSAVFSGIDLDVSPEDGIPEGITISSDGLTLFISGLINMNIFQYDLSVANDLSTAVYSGLALNISPEDAAPVGLDVSNNGFKIFMGGTGNNKIYQYNLLGPNSLDAGAILSTFETPLLTQAEDNFLVDNLGRRIGAVQS